MSKSFPLVWASTLLIFAGHNSDFRTFVAPQAAEAANRGQSKATEFLEGSLGGKGPCFEGYSSLTAAPLQIYTAEASPGQVGAAQWEPFFRPLRRSYDSSVVWGLRGQPIPTGLLLPAVWWQADGVLSATNGCALDVNRLGQKRIAKTKTLASAQAKCGYGQQGPRGSCQHGQRCSQRQRQGRWWKEEVRPDFQIGAASRGLGGANFGRDTTAAGASSQYVEAIDRCSRSACQCGKECPGQFGPGPCSQTGGPSEFHTGTPGGPPPGGDHGEGKASAPGRLSAAKGPDRAGKSSIGQAAVSEWLASIFVSTRRPLGQADRSTDNSFGGLRCAGAPVGQCLTGSRPDLAGACRDWLRGRTVRGYRHGRPGICNGPVRGQGCGNDSAGAIVAAAAGTAPGCSAELATGSPGCQRQGRFRCSCGSCARKRPHAQAEARGKQAGHRGADHRPRVGRSPWQGPELRDAQWRVTSGREAWHSVTLEPDYVSPSLALVLGRALALQVLCGGDEQTLDPRIGYDTESPETTTADSYAPGVRGLCRHEWDCAWDSAGLLVPVDPAAPGASVDCSAHRSVHSSLSFCEYVQTGRRSPNPRNPCCGNAGAQVPRLSGMRSFPTSNSSRAAKLAGRCVRFGDIAPTEQLSTQAMLWLQASRAFRCLPSSFSADAKSTPRWEDESFPPAWCSSTASRPPNDSAPPQRSSDAPSAVGVGISYPCASCPPVQHGTLLQELAGSRVTRAFPGLTGPPSQTALPALHMADIAMSRQGYVIPSCTAAWPWLALPSLRGDLLPSASAPGLPVNCYGVSSISAGGRVIPSSPPCLPSPMCTKWPTVPSAADT